MTPVIKTGDRIRHTKFGIGTVVGPWSEEDTTWVLIFNADAVTWGVLFDDETVANKRLAELNQPPLNGKPFPIVPSLEAEDIKVITQ